MLLIQDRPIRIFLSSDHVLMICTGKSNLPTAGSFVRPSRPADQPRGFLEALHEKYAADFEAERTRLEEQRRDSSAIPSASFPHEAIEISGKLVEEVGFDKIRKKLAELQELKIVLLDGLRVVGVLANDHHEPSSSSSSDRREQELLRIRQTCPRIAELDLSRNLLTRWTDVKDICAQLTQLKLLKLE